MIYISEKKIWENNQSEYFYFIRPKPLREITLMLSESMNANVQPYNLLKIIKTIDFPRIRLRYQYNRYV